MLYEVITTNAQSRNMEEALLRDNIPYKVVGSMYFYKRKEIKDLLCYLNVIYNSNDDISLLSVITSYSIHYTKLYD